MVWVGQVLAIGVVPVNGIRCSHFRVFLVLFKELCGLLWALFIPKLVKDSKLSLSI